MTLDQLRLYYRLREYQITHLQNAQKCNKHMEQQMYFYLLFWADAMYQADEMRRENLTAFIEVESWKARGLK